MGEKQKEWETFTSSEVAEYKVDNEKLVRRLKKPKGKVDVVLDTDTYNEIN